MGKIEVSRAERELRRTTLYLSKPLAEYLDIYMARNDPGEEGRNRGQGYTITLLMGRYHALVTHERRYLRKLFTKGEVELMLNNALSKLYDIPGTIPGTVLADTEDEAEENFKHFEVDKATLVEKLDGLNVGQQFALVDWLEEMRSNTR